MLSVDEQIRESLPDRETDFEVRPSDRINWWYVSLPDNHTSALTDDTEDLWVNLVTERFVSIEAVRDTRKRIAWGEFDAYTSGGDGMLSETVETRETAEEMAHEIRHDDPVG